MASQDHPIYKHVQQDGRSRSVVPPAMPGASSPSAVPAPAPMDAARVSSGATPAQPGRSAPPNAAPAAVAVVTPEPAAAERPSWWRRLLGAAPPAATDGRRPGAALTKRDLKQREKLIKALRDLALKTQTPGRIVARAGRPTTGVFADLVLAGVGEPKLPDEMFARLHWGGVFAYVGTHEKSVRNLAEAYDNKRGFCIDQPVTPIHAGMRLPGMRTSGYCFMARKYKLLQPGDTTERFTYHVELSRCAKSADTPDGYLVTKRVPTYQNMVWRLRQKFPDVDVRDLEKRAHKLVDHVFPTFLTREAAMLGILQKNLAPEYRNRVPRPLGIEKDNRGFVRTLHMNWMRIGGPTLSQLDFAEQAAELLSALHEQARVMHLDLRMDNMVITPHGVGFVDFGSACRIGEQIGQSPMLDTLFSEMMRTSQIQKMLGKMLERGHVTNQTMANVHGKVDKTVDSFYLSVQITKPHVNPELKQFIAFDPESDIAQALSALTAAVLRPKNPEMAQYKTAQDILRGIHRIRRRVERSRGGRPA
ncbi:hypothetical protein OT109_10980 [Phycisphaeraceae bacterium D3-23]